jgi:RNA-directed DNA polymerase
MDRMGTLLANIYLHYMRARFEKFAPPLHPDKTRLIEFGRFAAAERAKRGCGNT